jgi:serine/threonine protein kinase
MAVLAGQMIGPYEISAQIGAGGMGEVYRARDPRLGRDVAIKLLPASFSADPDRLQRFAQEARAAAALNHPNILAIYDIGESKGAPYVVSELLEGETLRERLRTGALSTRRTIEFGLQIARGLAAAHDKGIVAWSWERSVTCLPNKYEASRQTTVLICSRSAPSSTK